MGRKKQATKRESETDQSDEGTSAGVKNTDDKKIMEKDTKSRRELENDDSKSCSKNFNMEEEFKKLFQKAKEMGLTEKDFSKSQTLRDIRFNGSYINALLYYALIFLVVVTVVYFMFLFNCLLSWPISNETLIKWWFRLYNADVESEPCSVYMPEIVADVFRPPVECSFCKGVTEVKTEYNISQEEFERLYAYTGVPVVIGDGTTNWTAPKHFSFNFFKDMYKPGSQSLENQQRSCQFFPYKTDFESLADVLSMSKERALMKDGSKPWYVGWSNCDFSAANELRTHYNRPYFLPRLSESSKTDWIFMGSPGYGAHLHIDNVDKPSWQAQITGTKLWTLEPPPECYYVCEDQIQVTVYPGQIIVLDTNIWYHSTLNVGDDISITIGSEYD